MSRPEAAGAGRPETVATNRLETAGDSRWETAEPSRPDARGGGGGGPDDAWAGYLAAAQRLDAVRRVADSRDEQAQLTMAAHRELTEVRARLAPQRDRLVREFGVGEAELVPQPAERIAATAAVAGGPAHALAALRRARDFADAVNAATSRPGQPGPWLPWMRNMLVYGPFAAAVLMVQIVLYVAAPPDAVPTYALLCGLTLPVVAFGLGWVTIGFVFGGQGVVDRTPVHGALICLAPVLVTCMGVGLLTIIS